MTNTTTNTLQVANEIRNQLGHKALYMMGAKNLAGGENFLQFKIGRNAKNVTNIRIELNSMDLYDVKFYNCRGMNRTLKSEVNGIYNDMLHNAIEQNTEMYLSL